MIKCSCVSIVQCSRYAQIIGELALHLVENVFKQGSLEMELREEIDALRAILMNDVTTDVSDGVVRVDMKLEAGCRLVVNLKGIKVLQ